MHPNVFCTHILATPQIRYEKAELTPRLGILLHGCRSSTYLNVFLLSIPSCAKVKIEAQYTFSKVRLCPLVSLCALRCPRVLV